MKSQTLSWPACFADIVKVDHKSGAAIDGKPVAAETHISGEHRGIKQSPTAVRSLQPNRATATVPAFEGARRTLWRRHTGARIRAWLSSWWQDAVAPGFVEAFLGMAISPFRHGIHP